jgi:hypothetical protein
MEVCLLALPGLTQLASVGLGAERVIPRSVLLAGFEGGAARHLLVGLGDGALHSWRLDPTSGTLSGEAARGGGGGCESDVPGFLAAVAARPVQQPVLVIPAPMRSSQNATRR